MNGSRTRRTALAAGMAVALGASLAGPAMAHDRSSHHSPAPRVSTIVSGLQAPELGLAVSGKGTVYVSESFTGKVLRVKGHGTTRTVAQAQGFAAGLALGTGRNTLYYLADGHLNVLRGKTTTSLADLAAYEAANNPDSGNTYGFQGLSAQCAAQIPAEIPSQPYPGMVDSNPYAVATWRHGSVIVADAGGNSLLRVSKSGRISTLAVLPPVPLTVTAQMATGMGLPECTVGKVFNFEPVPTDVEVGRNGMLYVTSLPGGPEDASLGARGGVYRVNPWTGKSTRIASGFLGAVDLALDRHGRIYVAEMFGNAISKVVRGGPKKIRTLTMPGALEYANGRLYATAGAYEFGPTGPVPNTNGKVVSFRP